MLKSNLMAVLAALCVVQMAGISAEANDAAAYRLSGPSIHNNLAIYFVHGKSRSGPVPLTLQEALVRKTVEVREIGRVNELEVENTGDEAVFIQSGDIVKGGQQDRVLMVSLVLPPHSGPASIASFCVEQGRWSARGLEDAKRFSTANAALPSREAKIQMKRPAPSQTESPAADTTAARQREIWNSVAKIQGKLSSNLGASVAAPRSQSSLQLALENIRLEREQETYVNALETLGETADDIVGYVFAINGRLNSADIYPSNALFRKMWPKLLRASATEAISETDRAAEPPPSIAAVTAFIDDANHAGRTEMVERNGARVEVRQSAKSLYFEARPAAAPASSWVHRNYLAK